MGGREDGRRDTGGGVWMGRGGKIPMVWSGNTATWWDGGASSLYWRMGRPWWKDCPLLGPVWIAGGTKPAMGGGMKKGTGSAIRWRSIA